MDAVEKYRKGNQVLTIYQDENIESCREWDNLGIMVCFHGRYSLGDKHDINHKDFDGWSQMKDYIIKEKKAVVIFSVYLYDHSGLRMKIGSFNGLLPQGHAEFDSGQVGFIYTTKERIKERFGIKKVTDKSIKKAEMVLRGEIETYDKELSGSVYGFNLEEIKVCESCGETKMEFIDGCGGFYGYDFKENGLFDHAGIKDISEWEKVI